MAVDSRIINWIKQTYPKPSVDPAWLEACLAWISDELQLKNIDTQADEIISNVDTQLLASDLKDSMLVGTGLPMNIGLAEEARLWGRTLVQIQSITDIGHSAFSLQSVRQMRIDKTDLTGLAGGDNEDDDNDERILKYPRSMLRFELSDGSQVIRAIEYRRLPELELGVTPLGYKIILKDVPIRRGIAFLEPSNVILKGSLTEELDAVRDANFARELRMRLGRPESEPDTVFEANQQDADVPSTNNQPRERAPLRDMALAELSDRSPQEIPREEVEPPTRRRIPASSEADSSTVVSPYFPTPSAGPSTLRSSRQRSFTPSRLNQEISLSENTDDPSEFDDDLEVNDSFLEELDAAEQAAMESTQVSGNHALSREHRAQNQTQAEVIIIDSDSDDKENMAPVIERRVRRRIDLEDDADVLILD